MKAHVEFTKTRNGIVGNINTKYLEFNGYQKICFLDRRFGQEIEGLWEVSIIKDTKPLEYKGAYIVMPIKAVKFRAINIKPTFNRVQYDVIDDNNNIVDFKELDNKALIENWDEVKQRIQLFNQENQFFQKICKGKTQNFLYEGREIKVFYQKQAGTLYRIYQCEYLQFCEDMKKAALEEYIAAFGRPKDAVYRSAVLSLYWDNEISFKIDNANITDVTNLHVKNDGKYDYVIGNAKYGDIPVKIEQCCTGVKIQYNPNNQSHSVQYPCDIPEIKALFPRENLFTNLLQKHKEYLIDRLKFFIHCIYGDWSTSTYYIEERVHYAESDDGYIPAGSYIEQRKAMDIKYNGRTLTVSVPFDLETKLANFIQEYKFLLFPEILPEYGEENFQMPQEIVELLEQIRPFI